MTYQNENYEMIKQILLNEQLGNPKKLKLDVVEGSLSDEDKSQIRQAVFDNAINLKHLNPSELTNELIKSIKIINQA
ncbi:hypothetical protein JP33_05950 [Gallibacterium anatis CCM5995]|uniref:Uncharacterized protein n=1 Tax=Gallibacterium anatis (strain UMN179) TaxID=1005058 RepID=F4H933_GALAU|nr:hypothetical protein [Gallibacterium anatis]AEC18361.1 hypothetical protein UMN179_02352 [Gallibacterium anatis UMN179]KGQ25464.1 hypothetical protein JP33_05950 [Gallibacterium anatis CCM5995]KGQ37199.1 hypothetical protein JP30_11430 [Gallibacterium anatis IPDH697-78]